LFFGFGITLFSSHTFGLLCRIELVEGFQTSTKHVFTTGSDEAFLFSQTE
jgi:hypothetical protein